MNQAILDTRVFRKAAGPMIDATADAVSARARAIREEKHGRLVYVCSWCVPSYVKVAISDMPNLSHGICDACKDAAMAETAENTESTKGAAKKARLVVGMRVRHDFWGLGVVMSRGSKDWNVRFDKSGVTRPVGTKTIQEVKP